jgi:hypothetical protein
MSHNSVLKQTSPSSSSSSSFIIIALFYCIVVVSSSFVFIVLIEWGPHWLSTVVSGWLQSCTLWEITLYQINSLECSSSLESTLHQHRYFCAAYFQFWHFAQSSVLLPAFLNFHYQFESIDILILVSVNLIFVWDSLSVWYSNNFAPYSCHTGTKSLFFSQLLLLL